MHRFVVLAVLAGCSVSDAGAPPAPAPASTKALDRASVVCERAVRCGTIGASQLASCKQGPGRLTLVWGYLDLLGIDNLIAAGHLRRDPGSGQRCLAALASETCHERPPADTCGFGDERLLPGVAPGGTCTRTDECIDGFCSGQAGCQGTCIAHRKLGESCGTNQVCTDGAFCWDGVCRKRAIAGEACGGHWQWCADGLFCDGYKPAHNVKPYPVREVLGTCSAPLAAGASCLGDHADHCRAGLACAWGDPAPTCQAGLSKGARCRWLDACGDGLACTGLTLGGVATNHDHYAVTREGTCTPFLDAGAACDPTAYVSGCPQSMRCDRVTKRCRSTGLEGDACASSWITKPQPADRPIDNEGCLSSLYCDVATRTCKKQLAKGAACTPQPFGVEDEPCFLGTCDAKSRRCVAGCK